MNDLIYSAQSKTMLARTQHLFDKPHPMRDVLQKQAGYNILKRPQATKTATRKINAFLATFCGSFNL